MKKKLLSVLLVAALAVTGLTGCGGYKVTLPTEEQQSSIYVEKIEGLSEDFIRGMDVSIVLAEEASGVKYYTEDGEEEDVFQIMADAGVNYARIRVWNDPFDEDGNGYGGGNCTAETAAELGARAAKYGMKTCVDFHYSDFWADPGKQMCPKAWEGMTVAEKTEAIYDYTVESLTSIIKAGADVGMVQIGNEVNNGVAGESDWNNELTLLASASKAVRQVAEDTKTDIKIVCHFTQIDDSEGTVKRAGELIDAGVDYDVFGVSYYTYWHGTQENMIQVLSDIKEEYGKDTCVMETAYMYYGGDTDDNGNSCSSDDAVEGYPVSIQGQANNLRDVMADANEAGALGVFYWEGCWIAVGNSKSTNTSIWETYGSGWASSYASDYDPDDAGQYYGGSAWDNQALFGSNGKALASLNTFKYVYSGAVGEGLEVLEVENPEIEVELNGTLTMPEKVGAVYNDSSITDGVTVNWEESEVAAVDTSLAGTYKVTGRTDDGTKVTAKIKVAAINYLENASFEDSDTSMWVTEGIDGAAACTDFQEKAADANEGDFALHFWDDSDVAFETYQEVTGLAAGTYAADAFLQGGDVGSSANIYLYATVYDADGTELETYKSGAVTLDGWVNWKNPTIDKIEVPEGATLRFGVHVECASGGWGTMDSAELYAIH